MNTPFPAFVDSHIHLDQIYTHHPDHLDWILGKQCLPVSWAWARHAETITDLENYFQNQADVMAEVREGGLNAYFLCGIHPRNITQDMTQADIPKLVLPRLADPACLGVGEIGLEEATDREKEMLGAQLALANLVCGAGKVFGIHTPRTNKQQVLDELLSLLETFDLPKDRVVIDHLTIQTLGPVLERGYWAGVTLSPEKVSAEELTAMLNAYPEAMDRIMVNTDSGTQIFKDMEAFCDFGVLPEGVTRKITRDNALAFYKPDA